ncbi:aryl-sulfate sulfotransferase [Granulicella cerasi]|uniref:Aryl-sulfate sulfotransferase n=1 Tax=Granulicella cerasi TaxID=741063 RepID=A0ABW1ZCJ7_9BACT|nr:aryl-sulfate sulfotransferase [Granulicella cerasi]
MKTLFRSVSVLAAALALSSAAHAGDPPRVYPTGTTVYNPAKAYNSYVAFSGPDGLMHLIDMNGHEVKRWSHGGNPGEVLDPKLVGGARGHVMLQLAENGDKRGGIFTNKTFGEADWNDKTVWSWSGEGKDGSALQNHDWARLPNGHTLMLRTVVHAVPMVGPTVIGDQGIVEVDQQGKVVWTWDAGDHLAEFGFSPEGIRYLQARVAKNGAEPYGYLEINDMQVLGPNQWFDAGDKRFDPENIMIDARKGNVVLIISKRTGKVVWSLGPNFPGDELSPDQRIGNKTLPRPVDQISGQHNAHLIAKGLPGAGHLLLFDDEGGAGFPPAALGIYAGSRILEIDPVKKQIVWQYTGEDSGRPTWTFFSSFVSSAHRLPNGNTLICEGMYGRLFQITPTGEIVWEYVVPYLGHGKRGDKPFESMLTYRAQAVPYDWVPEGTPHTETPVQELDITSYRVGQP